MFPSNRKTNLHRNKTIDRRYSHLANMSGGRGVCELESDLSPKIPELARGSDIQGFQHGLSGFLSEGPDQNAKID